ncbi:hypothetical protein [Spiroplasma poulsonii]|uniref:hypothetical protein n=1 Tax=Spiroplasma poulsonii TaxID=2138 RepID=UPI00133143CD|nr:hypothetical protein [Spiroplasma poulsonii]KAF0849976.1 putative lipoprotein [Spiroplasma poulsonii]
MTKVYANDKPFNTVDNKYYFVVWKTNNWNITKFKNNTLINRWHPSIEIDSKNEDENYKLNLEWIRGHGTIVIRSYSVISDWPAPRFKTIYRWNGIDEPLKPQIIQIQDKLQIEI